MDKTSKKQRKKSDGEIVSFRVPCSVFLVGVWRVEGFNNLHGSVRVAHPLFKNKIR